MKISFVVPGRNNLKYFKWSYDSIQKNKGNHEVTICFADDASTDGSWEWIKARMVVDPYLKALKNEGPDRVGHTILYDRIVNELVETDLAMIWHCDMYLCPGALDAIEKQMYIKDEFTKDQLRDVEGIEKPDKLIVTRRNPKTICSLTRIEPSLHPPGPEKILRDFGVEPEEFNEKRLLEDVEIFRQMDNNPNINKIKTTEGIFAPWAFWVKDFQEIGGHDKLYAPQSKEDSDIFNRFQLNGVKFVQTWEGFVYHMTCRGSRRNTVDKAKNIYEDSPEWLAQNQRSSRNFIRKWGHFVKHDQYMKPIIPPKYDIGFRVLHCNLQLLEILEPWCNNILIDDEMQVLTTHYLDKEQPNTIINLSDRVKSTPFETISNEIIVYIDGKTFNNDDYGIIQQLSEIIKDNGQEGEFEIGNLNIIINKMNEYQKDLIICKN